MPRMGRPHRNPPAGVGFWIVVVAVIGFAATITAALLLIASAVQR